MLAQEAVARIVGVTASQVSKREHARGPFRSRVPCGRLARPYGVALEELRKPN